MPLPDTRASPTPAAAELGRADVRPSPTRISPTRISSPNRRPHRPLTLLLTQDRTSRFATIFA
jgi:hypothetical protein